MEEFAHLMNALASLAWPAIAIAFLFILASPIKDLIQSREFNVEVAGFKVSVGSSLEKLNAELADIKSKLAQLEMSNKDDSAPATGASTTEAQNETQAEASKPTLRSNRVLWVDDKPEGNAFAIAQFRSIGLRVDLAKSTAEGMRMFEEADPPYDLILSDIGRTEDGRYERTAGLNLLTQIRNVQGDIPVLFFTTRRTAQLGPIRQAVEADKNTYTTVSATELFVLINRALARNPGSKIG